MCQRCWGKAVPPRPEDLWRRTLNAREYAKGVLAESEAELDRLTIHDYPEYVIAFRASIVKANKERVDELDAAFRKLDEGEDKQS